MTEGGGTNIIDYYNRNMIIDDIIGTLTTQVQVGKCGVFLIAETKDI